MYKFDKYECAVMVKWKGTSKKFKLPCYPAEVSEQVSASWSQQTIIGRTGSLYAFTGTSDVSCNFSFDLHREMEDAMELPDSIDKIIRALKSACYPRYETNALYPPRAIFQFGDFVISGRMESVNTVWKTPIIDKKYAVCSVSVTMYSASTKIVSQKDIISGNGTYVRGHDTDHNPESGDKIR